MEANYWTSLPYTDSCYTLTWISHRYICIPPSWTPPTPLPPHPIPLGCPRASALDARLHASNLHCSSVLQMVIQMFLCYSVKSSHPHLLPQSPKVCSLLTLRILGALHLTKIKDELALNESSGAVQKVKLGKAGVNRRRPVLCPEWCRVLSLAENLRLLICTEEVDR